MTNLRFSADEELMTNSENLYDVLEQASTLVTQKESIQSKAVPSPRVSSNNL